MRGDSLQREPSGSNQAGGLFNSAMNALEPLPKREHEAILDLVRANELDESKLACFMTRQQDSGRGRLPDTGGGLSGPTFSISYNLILCEHCGNLEPRTYCPAKMRQLAAKWLNP